MSTPPRKSPRAGGSDGNETPSASNFSSELARRPKSEYFGWVYHLGVNKIGHEYCHLRFLFIRGKYVEMYKRDPHENPGIKPIRRGVVGHTFMVEELGRRKVNNADVYVLRFYNRLDESRKGEIACTSAGEAQKWMEAFDQAKQQAEYELLRGDGSARDKLNMEHEIDLEGHRPRVRKYAHGLKKLIRIGQGPETLLRQSSGLPDSDISNKYTKADGDVVDAHKWKCVCTLGGIRIFEDVADCKVGKGVLVKSFGVIDASADTVFEVLISPEPSKRYEWDMVVSELELIESLDGHYDVLYGIYDPKYFTWWRSKRDFVCSRQWFRGQDGTYTILHSPAAHKNKPQRSGYKRKKISPSSWEIKNLSTTGSPSESQKCLLTHMLEIDHTKWNKWKKCHNSKFETSIPFALLCQVAALKEYIGANPSLTCNSHATIIDSKSSFSSSVSNGEYDGADIKDEFYDAISPESDEDSDDEEIEVQGEHQNVKLKYVSRAIAGLTLRTKSGLQLHEVLDSTASSLSIDPLQFQGSLRHGKDDKDTNCWTDPGGMGFMIRGKTYLEDDAKVVGGDPLLKLVAVDWLKSENTLDKVALRPSCMVQSEAGRKLPFILVVNLQVPSKPNYNLVFYYAADRPVKKGSLLGRFIDGNDMFRDSRFKLIPSIIKGYWMVKRAVGTRACILGKAVTCRYLRQDNFLEIDVDIGSSSVARGVIGLVLGYVTSIVVDLAILLEAKEESELPEYLLGTVRLNCLSLDSAEQA